MFFNLSSIKRRFLRPTSFFGIKLWVAILTFIVLFIVFALCITLYIIITRLRRKARNALKPMLSKDLHTNSHNSNHSMSRRLLPHNGWKIEMAIGTPEKQVIFSSNQANFDARPSYQFTLTEIEAATDNFADENVVACGNYAVVYYGIMFGNTRVAVKRLLSSRAKAKEFTGEVEVLLSLRHKNLVKLLGYCFEGYYRIIVDEYVDNGNLGQWLHGCISEVSPLTWDIRMNILLGIAKGLAYLHEDIEPAIHQHLKSSSILLDKQWNPKISDFGITKLLGYDEWSYPITPPTGMSGQVSGGSFKSSASFEDPTRMRQHLLESHSNSYKHKRNIFRLIYNFLFHACFSYLAPEYLSTKILDDKSNIYSFGVLIMEIVSGKPSIEYTITEIEEYLIDWMKSMVASEQFDEIVDPKLPEMPCRNELKRVLLIALKCVDPDINNRPKMGNVINMLQPRDLLLTD